MTINGNTLPEIGEAARLWALRVADPAFSDWEMLTAWLGANPDHLGAYERALDDEAWATELFASQVTSPAVIAAGATVAGAPMTRGISRRRWLWQGAIAASVAAVAVAGAWQSFGPSSELHFETASGEHRTIALQDGSYVVMNGDTELRLSSLESRHVTMVRGEALFDVVHDENRPFIVDAGDTKLVDLGTVFNVVNQDGHFDVAVAEGVVEYQANQENIRLVAGEALVRKGKTALADRRSVPKSAIGTWRSGYLQYDGDVLSAVAGDLSRNIGRPVKVSSNIAQRRLYGTIMLDDSSEVVMGRAAALAGVDYARDGSGWLITSQDGETR